MSPKYFGRSSDGRIAQAQEPQPWQQWGKSDSERAKKPSRREGEPRTLEGRARRKMQFGQLYRSGCVFTYAEMMEVIKVLPAEKSPTISGLADSEYVAIEVIIDDSVERKQVARA